MFHIQTYVNMIPDFFLFSLYLLVFVVLNFCFVLLFFFSFLIVKIFHRGCLEFKWSCPIQLTVLQTAVRLSSLSVCLGEQKLRLVQRLISGPQFHVFEMCCSLETKQLLRFRPNFRILHSSAIIRQTRTGPFGGMYLG